MPNPPTTRTTVTTATESTPQAQQYAVVIKEAPIRDVWSLRHQVMWPDKPFDFIKIKGDEDRSIAFAHYGLYLSVNASCSGTVHNEDTCTRHERMKCTRQHCVDGDDVLVSVVSLFYSPPTQQKSSPHCEIAGVNGVSPTASTIQFRKFATMKSFQGKGYGSQLLSYVIDTIHVLGEREAKQEEISQPPEILLWCNARAEKVPFYTKFGLTPTGDVFNRNGKDYVTLKMILRGSEGRTRSRL